MGEIQTLTVKEAIEQGYTHWGMQIDDFQHLYKLEKISQADFDDANPKYPIVLAEKEPHYMGMSAESLMEVVIDQIMSSEEFGDDTDTVPDALSEMKGWDEFADRINEVLKGHPYWYLTQIRLIP